MGEINGEEIVPYTSLIYVASSVVPLWNILSSKMSINNAHPYFVSQEQ